MRTWTDTMEYVARLTAVLVVSVAVLSARMAFGQVTSDQAAAILVYPHVSFATEQGIDTIVQLTNTFNVPVNVRCFYHRAEPACRYTAFTIRLTPRQPIAWGVSAGLPTLPLSDFPTAGQFNGGLIPPVPDDPYDGSLECIAVGDDNTPLPLNVLIGQATIEQHRSAPTPLFDASTYRAIGIRARAGTNNGDAALVLGAEYDACPLALTAMHFFDGALDPVAKASSISTSLVLVSCSQNLTDVVRRDVTIEYETVNEFEQRLATMSVLHGCVPIGPLSQIDAEIPQRSIFHAAVTGTLTGQTRIKAQDDEVGVLGLMIETHHDLADPTFVRTALFTTPHQGVRAQRDAIVLPGLAPPSCTGDCNGDLSVTIDELLTGVSTALGTTASDACPTSSSSRNAFDFNYDGRITIDDIVRAVNNALYGCL